MTLHIQREPIPLEATPSGTLRIAGTRVTLESVVHAFSDGATPEQIAQEFDTLRLDDVYAVITYYLRHRDEVEAYLDRQERDANELRRQIESRFPSDGIRERLLRRRQAGGRGTC